MHVDDKRLLVLQVLPRLFGEKLRFWFVDYSTVSIIVHCPLISLSLKVLTKYLFDRSRSLEANIELFLSFSINCITLTGKPHSIYT